MEPKKRSPLAWCGGGCLGVIGFAMIVFAVGFSMTGHYMPNIPPPPAMPAVNALDDYIAAVAMLKAKGGTNALYPPGQLGAPTLANERPVVARNHAALARLREAFGKPCLIPRTKRFNDTFPYLAGTRDLARLLMAEADVKAAGGDYGGAFSSGIDGLQMGNDLMRGGLLIHSLVGVAVEAIEQAAMARVVDKLSAKDCDLLVQRLQRLILSRVPAAAIIREEHYFMLGSLARMPSSDFARHIQPASQGLDGFGESDATGGMQKALGSITWHFARDRTLKDLERYYAAMEKELTKPPRQRIPVLEPGGFAGIFAAVFSQATNRLDDIDIRNRLLLCAAAIRGYRLKHGALPASLRELGLDPRMLTDPYTGRDLLYRPGGADYLLYSVGPDGKDDGGLPADEGSPPYRGDLGLRRYDARPTSKTNSQPVPHMRAPKRPSGASPLAK